MRSVTREIGIVGMVTLALRTRAADVATTIEDEECPECLKRQRRDVA
jgi:hypothetical protein